MKKQIHGNIKITLFNPLQRERIDEAVKACTRNVIAHASNILEFTCYSDVDKFMSVVNKNNLIFNGEDKRWEYGY